MAGIFHHTTPRLTFTALTLALLFALTAQAAVAADNIENRNKETADAARPADTNAAPAAAPVPVAPAAAPSIAAPSIAYAAFSEAMNVKPEATPVGTLAKVAMPEVVPSKSFATMPLTPRAPAVSTAPMTAGEKFKFWVKSSILSPGAYAQSAFTGLLNELLDDDEGKKDTVENYFADSATRMARSVAFRITSGFFEKFAYATIFRQDPRYHRSGKRGAGAKLGYAITRVFVTQGDRCGCDRFNIAYLGGGVTAAFISNQWEREERATTSKALNRWASHIGFTMLGNILKEFLGGQ